MVNKIKRKLLYSWTEKRFARLINAPVRRNIKSTKRFVKFEEEDYKFVVVARGKMATLLSLVGENSETHFIGTFGSKQNKPSSDLLQY